MNILFADGFRGYSSGADMAQLWNFGAAPVIAFPVGAAATLRSLNGNASGVVTRDIEISDFVAISADVRLPASNGNARIGFSPAGYGDRNRSTSGSSVFGVYLQIAGLTPRIFYDILTGPTGTAVNSQIIFELEPMLAATTYHIEMIVDHREPISNTKIYINGALAADVGYNRDRISSGFQSLNFEEVSIWTSALSVGSYPLVSNLLVYRPSASYDPVGPVDITYLVTPDASLSIGPANDVTGITISDNAWTDFSLSDIPEGSEIVGAEMIYRLAAISGQDPATCEVALEAFGIQVGTTDSPLITPGYTSKVLSVPVPLSSLAPAILNDVTLKIRSVSGAS